MKKSFTSWTEYHDWLKENVENVSVFSIRHDDKVIEIEYEENKKDNLVF